MSDSYIDYTFIQKWFKVIEKTYVLYSSMISEFGFEQKLK